MGCRSALNKEISWGKKVTKDICGRQGKEES